MLSFVLGIVFAQAEQISSPINYNPSRMGVFSYLKVKDDLTLPGGLNTTTLNLRSSNKRLTANNKLLNVAVISTATTRKADIDFPYAVLGGNEDASVTNYSYTNAPGAGVSGVVRIRGGVLKALAGSSFISSLVTAEDSSLPVGIKMYANNLATPNIVAQGNSGSLVSVITENAEGNNDTSYGLKLGNYDIAYPSSGMTYKWVDMSFKNKQAKVLTLVKDGASCAPTHEGQSSYFVDCNKVTNLQLGSVFYTWNYSTCAYDENTSDCRNKSDNDSYGTWDYHGRPPTTGSSCDLDSFCGGSGWRYSTCSFRGISKGQTCSSSQAQSTCIESCETYDYSGHGNCSATKKVLICSPS